MKVTAASSIIRKHVEENYPPCSMDVTAIMLRACADTIDRLTKERDDLVKKLTEQDKKVINTEEKS